MIFINKFFYLFGKLFLSLISIFEEFGKFCIFHYELLFCYFKQHKKQIIFEQIEKIGMKSFWLIALVAIFTGMVLGIQFYQAFNRFSASEYLSYPIFITLSREIAPVFSALMLSSRSISAMSAELSSMRVSEQIDAIEVLGIDSKHYLLLPRIIATSISMPILVMFFILISNLSAYIVCVKILGVNQNLYIDLISRYSKLSDISISICKGLAFGYVVSLVGTYIGYNAKGGARGVGIATTNAVVYSAIAIFLINYIITSIFLSFRI